MTNEMPEWMRRQFDNAEATVATWPKGKRIAAGIEKDDFKERLSDILVPGWRYQPNLPIDDETLLRLSLKEIEHLRRLSGEIHETPYEGEDGS